MTELMTEGRIRLGAEIQRRRKQLGLTQEELAQRMDVSRQSVTKWETGQSAPDLDRLVQLGEVLKISLDELLKGPSDNADDNWNENEGEHAARDSAEEPCLHADPAPVCRESAFPSSLSFFLRLTGGLLLFVGLAGLLALWVFSVLFPVQIPGGNGSLHTGLEGYLMAHGYEPLFRAALGCACCGALCLATGSAGRRSLAARAFGRLRG